MFYIVIGLVVLVALIGLYALSDLLDDEYNDGCDSKCKCDKPCDKY